MSSFSKRPGGETDESDELSRWSSATLARPITVSRLPDSPSEDAPNTIPIPELEEIEAAEGGEREVSSIAEDAEQVVMYLSQQMRTSLQSIMGYSEMIEEDINDGHIDNASQDLIRVREVSMSLLDAVRKLEQQLAEERQRQLLVERLGIFSRRLHGLDRRQDIFAALVESTCGLIEFDRFMVFDASAGERVFDIRCGEFEGAVEPREDHLRQLWRTAATSRRVCIERITDEHQALACPIISGGDVAFVVVFLRCSPRCRAFTGYQAGVIQAFLTQMERALDSIRELDSIRRLALFDGLTGVLNRRGFFQVAERLEGERATLMLDIDHFKRINDTYGHASGDEVLREIAARIQLALRGDDLVGRYGGEEFAVVLPDVGLGVAVVVAQRLRHQINATPVVLADGTEVVVTASIGVAVGEQELGALLDIADRGLYMAKRQGRDRVEVARV